MGYYYYSSDPPHIVYVNDPPRIIRVDEGSKSREFVFSFEYLRGDGNVWMQALDKRDVGSRAIATRPLGMFYDDWSGNLIVAMGLQGVVLVGPDRTVTRVAIGRYSPTDFSFRSKARTFLDSLLHGETFYSTGFALLLAFSCATLSMTVSSASLGPRICFALAAAISVILAILAGVYPHVLKSPWESGEAVVEDAFVALSGFGLFPLIMVVVGLVIARPSRGQLLAIAAATIGMLLLIVAGALVLFETGPGTANVVAVGLVALMALGLWAYQRRRQTRR